MKKLINKLLIGSLAAPAILSTGLVASCAKKAEVIELHDVHGYQPMEDLLSYGEYGQVEIIDNYIQAVNNKPGIFESDIISSFDKIYYDTLANCLGDNFKLTACKMGVTNPVFGTTTAWEDGFDDLEYPTISFRQCLQLVYEKENFQEKYKTIREITLNVTYSDVIFYISEKSNDLGWGIGIYDQNIGSESLWAYERDSNPWSINFDCSDVEKRIIPLATGGEEITINKASYFSHAIDTTDRLRQVCALVTELKPDDELTLEQAMVKTILLLDIKSHFLSNTDNLFDIRIKQQLTGQVSATPDNKENNIQGFKLLLPKALGETPGIAFFEEDKLNETARIVWKDTESDIACNEIGGTRKLNFNIQTAAQSYKCIRLNLTPDNDGNWNVNLPFSTNWTPAKKEQIAFDINKNKFDIEFRYYRVDASGHKTTEVITITTYLHYNTVNIHAIA